MFPLRDIKIGTSGYSYPGAPPKGWYGAFYPEKKSKGFDELKYYSQIARLHDRKLFRCGADDFDSFGPFDVAHEALLALFAVHVGAHSFSCSLHLGDDI